MTRVSNPSALMALVSLFAALCAAPAAAQDPCMEIEPPPECFAVSVTPDGTAGGTHFPNTGGHSEAFTIENLGLNWDSYSLECSGSGTVTCTGLSQSSVAVGAGQSTVITAYYSVGAGGTGSLSVTATGTRGTGDGGFYTITVLTMGVAVTPDGQVTATRTSHTGGHSVSFTVSNTGTGADTYALTCTSTGSVGCGGVTPPSVNLGGSGSTNVTVTYSAGNVGTGVLTLTAAGIGVNDAGSYSVPVAAPAGAPVVDATAYAFDLQNYARCAQACFAATYAQSTVPYVSLDAPRTVTLVYNGDRVDPKAFVHVNVRPDTTYGQFPSEYRLEVKVNGVRVTFVNGDTILRFAYPGSTAAVRLGGEFNASSYATNAYPLDISVVALYLPSTIVTNTWKTKLVVVNETTSPIARGWTWSASSGSIARPTARH